MPVRNGPVHLICWCSAPTSPLALFTILQGCTNKELIQVSEHVGGTPGRIAWAEFAKRKGYFDFDVHVTKAAGRLDITFDGKAKPIHDLPQFS